MASEISSNLTKRTSKQGSEHTTSLEHPVPGQSSHVMEASQENSIFFTLPAELRNAVYLYCVPILHQSYGFTSFSHLRSRRGWWCRAETPDLLLTCKRIRKEVTYIVGAFATVRLNVDPRMHIICGLNPFNLSPTSDLRLELTFRFSSIFSSWSLASLNEFFEAYGGSLKDLRTIDVHCSPEPSRFSPPRFDRPQFIKSAKTQQEGTVRRLLAFALTSNSVKTIKFHGPDNRQLKEHLNGLETSVKAQLALSKPEVEFQFLPSTPC
ncbi:hypothetical protein SLS62_001847 [Diatrype stigma]|uniref:Uncharacterized protein n=1 Tax=Diatrype stigma TaxID=117547 RepID=A0AAN9UXN9_9PEZI